MIGPHEVLGMARQLGMGTTEFLARYADNGGTTLKNDAEGRCVFVTPEGCAVHPRRPLVCRLYPLGRAVDGQGGEKFGLFPRQEGCEADFGTDGSVAGFLASQGVAPYFEWARRYGEVYRRMLALLDRLGVEGKVEERDEGPGPVVPGGPAAPEAGAEPLSAWQDIDASFAAYCEAKGLAAPRGIAESIGLHLRAMGEWLDDLEARAGRDAPDDDERKDRP